MRLLHLLLALSLLFVSVARGPDGMSRSLTFAAPGLFSGRRAAKAAEAAEARAASNVAESSTARVAANSANGPVGVVRNSPGNNAQIPRRKNYYASPRQAANSPFNDLYRQQFGKPGGSSGLGSSSSSSNAGIDFPPGMDPNSFLQRTSKARQKVEDDLAQGSGPSQVGKSSSSSGTQGESDMDRFFSDSKAISAQSRQLNAALDDDGRAAALLRHPGRSILKKGGSSSSAKRKNVRWASNLEKPAGP